MHQQVRLTAVASVGHWDILGSNLGSIELEAWKRPGTAAMMMVRMVADEDEGEDD